MQPYPGPVVKPNCHYQGICRAAFQSNLNSLKEQADSSPLKFNKEKYDVGHLQHSHCVWYSLGTGRLGSNCRKDCAAPVAGKLTMSQWCSLLVMRLTVQAGLVKAQPAHQGNIIFLDLAPLRLHLEYFVQF